MPGREDYAKINSGLLSDERAHNAAELYVESGIASESTALAAVIGHVAMIGLWALRETDNGVLPGDGMRALRFAIPSPDSVLKSVLGALLGAKLLRKRGRSGVYVVGFRSVYDPVLSRRKKDKDRKKKSRGEASLASDSPQDVHGTSAGQSAGRPEDVQAQSRVEESSVEERREADSREARPADELPAFASLPSPEGKPSGLYPGQRLSAKAKVAVGAILNCLSEGNDGADWQTKALVWRQLHRNGALDDVTGAMLLDRYKTRFAKSIGIAKKKEGLA